MNEEERIALWKLNAAYARLLAARCDLAASAIKAAGSMNRFAEAHNAMATREANELLATHPDLVEVNAMTNGFYDS